MGNKVLIYQVLPRLWGNPDGNNKPGGSLAENGCGHFSSFDAETFSYVRSLGCTHIWYTGVLRHATAEDGGGCIPSCKDWVKGRAGSPYAIEDYYDVNPYLADNPDNRMNEFEDLINRTRDAGLGVIIDFVPNHVARDYGRISPAKPSGSNVVPLGAWDNRTVHWAFDNDFYYYPDTPLTLPVENQTYEECPARASGNAFTPSPSVNDWYETVKLNYCDAYSPTWQKMYEIVRFWASKGVQGFRCDMVELVPEPFFKWLIARIKEEFPDIIFIAEVYNMDSYRQYIQDAGFDYLYDKSGSYDTLRGVIRGERPASDLTSVWKNVDGIQGHMLGFLENHDEQRLASDFFAGDPRKAYPALAVSVLGGNGAFMLYAGEEVGEKGMDSEGFSGLDGRTTIFDWWSVKGLGSIWESIHGGQMDNTEKDVLKKYRYFMNLAADHPAFSGLFWDLVYCNSSSQGFDPSRHYAFLRSARLEDGTLNSFLVVANFSDTPLDTEIYIPPECASYMSVGQDSLKIRVSAPAWDSRVVKIV